MKFEETVEFNLSADPIFSFFPFILFETLKNLYLQFSYRDKWNLGDVFHITTITPLNSELEWPWKLMMLE